MNALKKIGKFLLIVLKVIGYFLATVVIVPCYMIFYLFTGESIKLKLFFIAYIGGLVSSFFLNKTVFFILIGGTLAFFVFASILAVIPTYSLGPSYKPTMKDRIRSGFLFRGLAPDAAKKRYRELQKQYHPDNAEGDAEMSQQINDQYREYCEAQAKKTVE